MAFAMYCLDSSGRQVLYSDPVAWSRAMALLAPEKRVVAQTYLRDSAGSIALVSTCYLGVPRGAYSGAPGCFETWVSWSDDRPVDAVRHGTRAKAEEGHQAKVAALKAKGAIELKAKRNDDGTLAVTSVPVEEPALVADPRGKLLGTIGGVEVWEPPGA